MVVSCSDSVSVPFLREFFEADTSVLVGALGQVGLNEPSLGETGFAGASGVGARRWMKSIK